MMNSNLNESTTTSTTENSSIDQSTEKGNDEIKTTNESKKEKEEKNSSDDDRLIEISSELVDKNQGQAEEEKLHHNDEESRSKKSYQSRVKYSQMHQHHRSAYLSNGNIYGALPYYYYQPMTTFQEKPLPLMLISTNTTATIDNSTVNSSAISPQNLPPRLRQTSATENESIGPPALTSQINTSSHRRHRTTLSKNNYNYCSSHLPPPLMATPPGVLFTYPSGHIAYNIRTAEESELLAIQPPFMGIPSSGSPIIWPTIGPYPHFPAYPAYGTPTYGLNNLEVNETNNSGLNPEAAEWVPQQHGVNESSKENILMIDDEINFPPLNSIRSEENGLETKKISETSTNQESTSLREETSLPETSSITSATVNTSETVTQEENKPVSASKSKPISYSTVISQTVETSKSTKIDVNTNANQRRSQPSSNSTSTSTKKDRLVKQNQQRSSTTTTSKEFGSNRRFGSSSNRNYPATLKSKNRSESNRISPMIPVVHDDWIEVKSKKTKKFDRAVNEHVIEQITHPTADSPEATEKFQSPASSISSAVDNTTTTSTSDDDDDLPNTNDSGLVIVVDTANQDYNRTIIDDIHRRLDEKRFLLIVLRGCPGSGKSTLAKALNKGYEGQIFSTDEFLIESKSNDHPIDYLRINDIHRSTHQSVMAAMKKKITPIIIDNTNLISTEMKPYVIMGQKLAYEIVFIEPQTPWRYKPRTLVKRNLHNLPLRQIREMLNRFEHNVTVENILQKENDEISNFQKSIVSDGSEIEQSQTSDSLDFSLTPKKSYPIIDDTVLLNDTSQSSTSLSLSFSDLSTISSVNATASMTSSLPTTPSSPHSLLHRSFSRFSSSANSQEHSFNNEHLLRLPTTAFSRCIDNLTSSSSSSTKSNSTGKKRRKNKTKQDLTDEQLFDRNNKNKNNNNNNKSDSYHDDSMDLMNETSIMYLPQANESALTVLLPEECTDLFVIDESLRINCSTIFGLAKSALGDNSSASSRKINPSQEQNKELLNIIRDEYSSAAEIPGKNPSMPCQSATAQTSPKTFQQSADSSNQTLFDQAAGLGTVQLPPKPPPMGRPNIGGQHDGDDDDDHDSIQSLEQLIEIFVDRIPVAKITSAYELCQNDLSWTKSWLKQYLTQSVPIKVPSLKQLSYEALEKWDDQLRQSNPSGSTISIQDLLEDLNDERLFERLNSDENSSDSGSQSAIQVADTKHVIIPWSHIHRLQALYGDLPNIEEISPNPEGFVLPLDDELTLSIYQALLRFLGISCLIDSDKSSKPVNKQQKNPKQQQAQAAATRLAPSKFEAPVKTPVSSFREIMQEDMSYEKAQKAQKKPPLTLAAQHKFKNLKDLFSSYPEDLLDDIFRANECDFDLTRVCLSTMQDESPLIMTQPKPVTRTQTHPTSVAKNKATKKVDNFETLRNEAHQYALKRKECYQKADQAHRHNMTGVVSYYVDQAHQYSLLMKKSNESAFNELAKIRFEQFQRTHSLDLHDFYADEALNLFKKAEDFLLDNSKRTSALSIQVITGYGKGSIYGAGHSKLRKVIGNYLNQKKYKYSEPNRGAFEVQFISAHQ